MGEGMKEKHNGIISFWKFIFSLLILALHLGMMRKDAIYYLNIYNYCNNNRIMRITL